MKTVLASAMLLASAATAAWAAATCLPIVNNAPVVDGIVVGGDIGRPDTVKIPASCPVTTADPGWAGVSGRGIDHVVGPAGAKTPTLFFATHRGDGASMDKAASHMAHRNSREDSGHSSPATIDLLSIDSPTLRPPPAAVP
jgi:hypothetical protein